MDTTIELKANNPENFWIAIDQKTGNIIFEGKTPMEVHENIDEKIAYILSFVTSDSKMYIF